MAHHYTSSVVLLVFLACVLTTAGVVHASVSSWAKLAPPDTVKAWAEQLGKSLLALARNVTKETDIQWNYNLLGALVKSRDGSEFMAEIRSSIEAMVKEKMMAVQCLMEAAEEASNVEMNFVDELENDNFDDGMFTYASAKFSPRGSMAQAVPPTPTPAPNFTSAIAQYRSPVPPVWYRPLDLTPDPHFHNIPVNDTFSTVHVPVNVYDRAPAVIEAISWSENLDKVFSANYKADPSLTWQYFGSTKGFMRQFPGVQWRSTGVDLYDCRTQPWYISAVTCSKDVVLLIDVSGSMTGMRFSIARLVAQSLLETLTSNDFVAVLNFTDNVGSPVPCFNDMLVQATKENIEVLKEALEKTVTEGYGNFTAAFTKAFQLLEKYRESRDCGIGGCNQAIMLITDGVPGNLTEVFDMYNRLNVSGEGETIPVRVFTYLLGKEVTNVREIQWMACENRGYYTHMQSLEEVREEALRYLNVVARPLVLEGTQHPIVWTHAYADFQDAKVSAWLKEVMQQNMERDNKLGRTQAEEDRLYIMEPQTDESLPRKVQQFRLMTSVSIPVIDHYANQRNNESRSAELLGVAGLDVPLILFEQLSKPHKIGVNGYAFIITNNGYILMHPNLKPVVQGRSRVNFNSVDLTEIELVDDESEKPRILNPQMNELRQAMVEHRTGNTQTPIKIKFAYDDMRRVAVEPRNFFYAPIDGTPFTLGLTLSPKYGRFTVGLGEKFPGITSMNYFHGNNWRIHPDWIYCRHQHDNFHDFSSPEERLKYFLQRRDQEDKNWKWKSDPSENPEILKEACGRPAVPEDAYYCDQELMERLILEAKAIKSYYGTETWDLRDMKEHEAVQKFNVTMRFVATHSGLTRWQHVHSEDQDSKFGDWNSRAVDEDWYRAAVFLHEEIGDSFMFTVPFDAGPNPDTPVTAYGAIYSKDGIFEVPVSVVGFQMPLLETQEHLFSISETLASAQCLTSREDGSSVSCGCATEEVLCYLLDAHGYVIVSEDFNDTGRFFGDVAPDTMAALHRLEVYRKIVVYDYQALCFKETHIHSGAAELFLTPIRWIQWLIGWIIGQFMQVAVSDFLLRPLHAAEMLYDDDYYVKPEVVQVQGSTGDEHVASEKVKKDILKIPCDKMRTLALLQMKPRDEPRVHIQTVDTSNLNATESDPPTYRSVTAQRVPHTNLLLVVIDGLAAEVQPESEERWSAAAATVVYGNDTAPVSHPCHKLPLNDLPRRRLAGCLSHHPLEAEITQCGRGSLSTPPAILLALCASITLALLLRV